MSTNVSSNRASRISMIALALAAQAACASIIGLEAGTPREDDKEAGSPPDVLVPTVDGSAPVEAGGDPATYNAFDDLSRWSKFDLLSLRGDLGGFYGGAFDGKRVFFTPQRANSTPVVASFDPTQAFDAGSAWQTFNFFDVQARARGYIGAVRVGDRLFFPPNGRIGGLSVSYHGLAMTHSPAEAADAGYAVFDMGAQLNASAVGTFGGASDGTNVYFAPFLRGTSAAPFCNSMMARYDSRLPYSAPTSWLTFDISTALGLDACGFSGAIFDGRFVYAIPHYRNTIARYDTTAYFVNNTAWSGFDLSSLSASANHFAGAVFDGRYIYLVPTNWNSTPAITLRYDTQQAGFDAGAGPWTVFAMSQVSPDANGFAGGTFDGRYVYYVPERHGLFVRYDTRAPFDEPASWSTMSFQALGLAESTLPSNFRGAIFDGKSVYFVPQDTVVVRFDAKDPPGLPSFHPGSFL